MTAMLVMLALELLTYTIGAMHGMTRIWQLHNLTPADSVRKLKERKR